MKGIEANAGAGTNKDNNPGGEVFVPQ